MWRGSTVARGTFSLHFHYYLSFRDYVIDGCMVVTSSNFKEMHSSLISLSFLVLFSAPAILMCRKLIIMPTGDYGEDADF